MAATSSIASPGFVNITIRHVELRGNAFFTPGLAVVKLTFADKEISSSNAAGKNRNISIERSTSELLLEEPDDEESEWKLDWNESFEVPSRPGMGVRAALTIYDPENYEEMFQMHLDLIDFEGTHLDSRYDFSLPVGWDGPTIYGNINLDVDFFPNHQSFVALCIECSRAPQLPLLLLTELRNKVEELSEESVFPNESVTESLARFCDQLDSLLRNGAKLRDYASAPLNFESAKNAQNAQNAQNASGTLEVEVALERCKKVLADVVVENGMDKLFRPYHMLVAKQVSLFNRYWEESESERSSESSSGSVVASASEQQQQQMTESRLTSFFQVALVWIMQQGFLAGTLVCEYGIEPKELMALAEHFFHYDSELKSEMRAAELGFLLEDMGQRYSETELALVLESVDSDQVGVVDFAEFVRWWCTDMSLQS
jgi:Ca2+-binding EF-hand superfamily protein